MWCEHGAVRQSRGALPGRDPPRCRAHLAPRCGGADRGRSYRGLTPGNLRAIPAPAGLRRYRERMWSMYGTQSMRTMLASLGIGHRCLRFRTTTVGFSADREINTPGADQRVRAFLELPSVEAALTEHIEDQRTLLGWYIRQRCDLAAPLSWLTLAGEAPSRTTSCVRSTFGRAMAATSGCSPS